MGRRRLPDHGQAYVTREVLEHNYRGLDTRGWFRMIIPLWTAPALPQKPRITKG
jgi:hypothetical protein